MTSRVLKRPTRFDAFRVGAIYPIAHRSIHKLLDSFVVRRFVIDNATTRLTLLPAVWSHCDSSLYHLANYHYTRVNADKMPYVILHRDQMRHTEAAAAATDAHLSANPDQPYALLVHGRLPHVENPCIWRQVIVPIDTDILTRI